jgi:energy-coupling factor transporter transmembrane protein EcfT
MLSAATVLTSLLSLALLVTGLWLALRHHVDCLQFLEGPILFLGAAFFLASLLGLLGIAKHQICFIWAYLVLLLLLLLLLFSFTLFGFFVSTGSSHGGSSAARSWGPLQAEFQLQDYSHWFQDKVLLLPRPCS